MAGREVVESEQFVGIAFGVLDGKLVAIAASNGLTAVDIGGVGTREALALVSSFKFQVSSEKEKPIFVVYDSAHDFELLLRDLPDAEKDKLFGVNESWEPQTYGPPPWLESLKAGKHEPTQFGQWRLSLIPGKLFRLSQMGGSEKKRALPIYDVYSFFDHATVSEVAQEYLRLEARDLRLEKNLLPLWEDKTIEALIVKCEREAELIAALSEVVREVLLPLDLRMRQWYGPAAVASRCLAKWKARRQAKRLHYKNTAQELLRAIDCAYIGGRVEALKLGTIEDVRTFDLNSAYAYATALLSQFYRPLRFSREHVAGCPFSCWLIDYALPESATIGVVPTRAAAGGISWRRRGRSYVWQPEFDYLARTYPDCFEVIQGYYAPPDSPLVTFGPEIEKIYDYRLALKAEGRAGEKILKLALANLYGKFAQNAGGAFYQCRAWAGWITSFVRQLLLEAVTGIEDQVICFAQDAIHITGVEPLGVRLGSGLGEWKRQQYRRGLYIAPGLYRLEADEAPGKQASRGVNHAIDFDRVASDLSSRQAAELTRSFVVGWQLARQAPLKYGGDYLQEVAESLELIPGNLRARMYTSKFDWLKENRNSQISNNFSGQLSARYIPQQGTTHPLALRLQLKDRGWI